MLGRALKEHTVPLAKPPPPKPSFSSTPQAQNGNIQDQFNQARQSTKSISGYTGYRNPPNALQAKSSNQKFIPAKRELNAGYASPASTASTSSSTFSRISSTASSVSTVSSRASTSGLQKVLSKQDAFVNTPDRVVDLAQDDAALKKQLLLSQQHVAFDENDFDDDDDLDLDMDYDLPMSMAAPPKPMPKTTFQPLPPQTRQYPPQPSASKNPTSSAQTWSSSPPCHKVTPKRRFEEEIPPQLSLDSSQPVVPADQPRAAKRRTLPWMAQKAEEEAEAARKEEEEEKMATPSAKKCFRCQADDHFTSGCSSKSKGKSAYDFTPLPKDKHMPWNTTATRIAQDKRTLKDKQVKRKAADADVEEAARKSDKKARMAPMMLSEEQRRVQDLVVNQQKSVFFTGSAGTGKSVLMRSIIAELRNKYKKENDRVAVTASTGLAACNIGGVTLHSFGGIGLGKEDVPTLVKKIKRNAKAKNRWIKTKILVIDEISMVDGDLFDKLEGIARTIRNNGRPFGGIQLVITGDFFQLPPVPDYDNKSRGAKFAFDAGTWSTSVHHTIGLTQVFRQKDPVFANMLNEMRLGKISDATIQAFRKLSRKINYNDSLDATELFPTRNEVEHANSTRMRSLAGKLYNFEAVDSGTIVDQTMRDKLLANMMAPKSLALKKGSQVMLIKNMDDNLVNGSLGKVVAFMNEKTFEIYHQDPDILDESIATEDLNEEGKSQRSAIKNTAKILGGKEYPLVRFTLADGTSRDLLLMPEEWKIELPNGEIQAKRLQLPLILAWALSIHKAQGQTLERVKIDLKKIFEKGQAYVALSRATSQAGLEVLNFDKSKVMAHPRVAEFYDGLYSVNKALQHPTVAEPPSLKKAPSYEERFQKQGGSVYELEKDSPAMAYG